MNHMIECAKLTDKLVTSIAQKIVEDVQITKKLADDMKKDFLYDAIFDIVQEAYQVSDFIKRHPEEEDED